VGSDVLAQRALTLAQQRGDENFRLATSLIEFARAADPNNNKILAIYSEILSKRAEHETSLMARNIFRAASREFQPRSSSSNNQDETDGGLVATVWNRIQSALGLADKTNGGKSNKVSACELTFEWFDEAQDFVNQSPYKELIAQKLNNLYELARGEGLTWNTVESSANGITITTSERAGMPVFRSVLHVDFPPKVVMTLIVLQQYRKLWDIAAAGTQEHELTRVNLKTSLRQQMVPGRMMIAGRELCYLTHWAHNQTDNSFSAIGFSLPPSLAQSACPSVPDGFIRMDLLTAGLRVEPLAENPNASRVTYVFWADTKGLPPFINRHVGITKVKTLTKLKDLIKP
jgi:hypothetical protein